MQFKSITNEIRVQKNTLFRRNSSIFLNWLEHDWMFSVEPCSEPIDKMFLIEIEWGGATIILGVGYDWMVEIAQSLLGEVKLVAIPESLSMAVLETAFGEIRKAIEETTKKMLRFIRCDLTSFEREGLYELQWLLDSSSRSMCGRVWLDKRAHEWLAEYFEIYAQVRFNEKEWDALPIPLLFSLGYVDLTVNEVCELNIGDVILFDECWFDGVDKIAVRVDKRYGFFVQLDNTSLIVTQGIGEIMAGNFTNSSHLDDIPVRLMFDLGESTLSLRELRLLAPGYTFDLGRDLRRTVTVRANGCVIGEGELIEIEGRIGVSLISIDGLRLGNERVE